MSGLFLFTLLLGVVAMSVGATAFRLEKETEENEVALALRGTLFGIPIPDWIASIPIIGSLVTGGTNALTNFTGSVFSPAIDLVSVVTSGALSKQGPLFKFVDNAVGGAFSALSGDGGIHPPILDTGALINLISGAIGSAGNASNSILTPFFNLLNIPGNAIGSIIKSFSTILQSLPQVQIVPGSQPGGPSPQNQSPNPANQPGTSGQANAQVGGGGTGQPAPAGQGR